jgi:glutamyl-tRNA reductase
VCALNILVVGLNHKTAPVEVRERVSVPEAELASVLAQLRQTRTLLESVVVSTCNRTEVYAVAASTRAAADYLHTWLAQRAGMRLEELVPCVYVHEGPFAVRHLLRVACGLDSMVMGETQILGQVRTAWQAAQGAESAGALLNRAFHLAVETGKRAQTETDIGKHAVSVSYAAVQLGKKVFDRLESRRALVIGAGETGRLTAQHLLAQGVSDLAVINRTWERAQAMAAELGGRALPWEALGDVLAEFDIVVSATGAPGVVITAHMVEAASRRRHHRPQLLLDIAVPRDIDPAAANLSHVFLFDIDDLEGVVAANLAERERAASAVERMIEEALQEFGRWLAEQKVVPLITAIRNKGIRIQESVMASLERKLPHLSERERKLLSKHTMSIVNQLLRDPIQQMKELAIASGDAADVARFARLFGISEEELASTAAPWSAVTAADGAAVDWDALLREWQQFHQDEGGTGRASVQLSPAMR